MPNQKPSRLLSIFLIKPDVTNPEEIFKEYPKLERHSVRVNATKLGDLYWRKSMILTPRWLSLFRPALDITTLGLKSANAGAVLLVKRRRRTFAVAFGQGRHLLNTSSFEENFGLHTTLNSIDPQRIRTIDRKRFDSISRLTREQAARDVPIFDFGLEIDQDMLRGVTGHPLDPASGSRCSGRDSLSVAVPLELEDLGNLLDKYLDQSQQTTYKTAFPWVDTIEEIRDTTQREVLDAQLLEKIKARDLARIWLVVPDLVDWADIGGFTYTDRNDAARAPDIDFPTYLSELRTANALSLALLKRHRIRAMSEATDSVLHDWTVYKCIYAELDTPIGTFLLDNGKWYKVDRDLVSNVDRDLGKIRASSVSFPRYRHLETEEVYNRRVAESDRHAYALMDRKTISYGGGRSQIEFCDLFTRDRAMIHVKRYSGSSVLSHLFSQGVVSATLLLWDDGFRTHLNKKLPRTHRLPNPKQRPRTKDYEIAFAVASNAEGPLTLPFFSRVTLRNAYRQLTNYGFQVTCTKIEMDRTP